MQRFTTEHVKEDSRFEYRQCKKHFTAQKNIDIGAYNVERKHCDENSILKLYTRLNIFVVFWLNARIVE